MAIRKLRLLALEMEKTIQTLGLDSGAANNEEIEEIEEPSNEPEAPEPSSDSSYLISDDLVILWDPE